MNWKPGQFPPMRSESHYGSRVVDCFIDRPSNLYALLADSAARAPQAEALVGAGQRFSWSALAAEVEASADRFEVIPLSTDDDSPDRLFIAPLEPKSFAPSDD